VTGNSVGRTTSVVKYFLREYGILGLGKVLGEKAEYEYFGTGSGIFHYECMMTR
jgi:hypothetical protein